MDKDRIFKSWNEGTSDRWNNGSVDEKTKGDFVGSEDGKDEVRTDGEDDGTNKDDVVRNWQGNRWCNW